MSNFKERLEEILDYHHLGCCGGDYCEWSGDPRWDENFSQALQAILELLKAEIPLNWSREGSEPQKTIGWNAYRSELIKVLGL